MTEHLPVILIEVVLVFGGVLAFGWWQLRSVKRDRLEAAARRGRERSAETLAGKPGVLETPSEQKDQQVP